MLQYWSETSGTMGETHIVSAAMSPSWIAAEYANQANPTNLPLAACVGTACSLSAIAADTTHSNWTGSGCTSAGYVPGNGDTVTTPPTYSLAVDQNWTVGNSPADTATSITGPALTVDGSSGSASLTVASGATLTMRGSVMLISQSGNGANRATVTLQSGSTLIFDASQAASPSTTVYRIYPNAADTITRVILNGSSSSHVTVRGRPASCSTCANAFFFDYNGRLDGTHRMSGQYAELYDLGCATCVSGGVKHAIEVEQYYPDATDNVFSLDHMTFTRTAGIGPPSGQNTGGASSIFTLSDIYTYNSLAPFLTITHALGVSTGTRSITNSYFDTGWSSNVTSFNQFTLNWDVFDGIPSGGANAPAAASFTNSALRFLQEGGGGDQTPAGSQDNIYYYADTAAVPGNSEGVRTIGPASPGTTVSNVVYEYGDASNGSGHTILPYILTTPFSVQNVLSLPTAQNKVVPSGGWNTANNDTTGGQSFSHNTIVYNTYCTAGSLDYGEQSEGTPNNLVSLLANNIFANYGTTSSGGYNANPVCPTTGENAAALVTANHFVPAGIHNNAVWGYAPVSRWVSTLNPACTVGGVTNQCTNNGTPYDAPTTGSVPGANDVHQRPYFVWENNGVPVGIREWALNLHGVPYPGGGMSASYSGAAAFAVFGTGNVQSLLTEMFAYIRGQWIPQNPALWKAGADGADIGAVDTPIVRHIAPSGMTP
jgi:hypothetical protein